MQIFQPGRLSLYFFLFLFLISAIPATSFGQKTELINSGDLLKQGTTAQDSGFYKKALTIYSKISRSDTNYVKSLYQRAVSCEADSQFKQAIKYCEEALALPEQREIVPDLYNIYGNSLHDDGQPEKAIAVFDSAIARYPAYSLLYFNKGVVLLAQDHYAQAETLFQKALLVNPYMYSAHYQLGLAALKQGKLVPAFLCFTGYLLMNPSGKYYSKSVGFLDQIAKATDAILDYKNKRTINPDENYQAVEDIVLSKIALDKGYKPIIALDDPISRQIQALFEKLEYSDTNNDFYIQYYMPYYRQVFTAGKFELFINHIFANAKLPLIQDYNKKNKKALEGFVSDATVYFDLIRATRELSFIKRPAVESPYYFENGILAGKGALANGGKILTGHWEFYYPAGNRKASGDYDSQGRRQGDWVYYRTSGVLKAKEHYKDGKLQGIAENYFENGNLSSRELYLDDKQDGLTTTYYYAGHVKSTTNYRSGKKEGESKSYYSNGDLYTVAHYAGGQLTGMYEEHYKGGGVKETQLYAGDKADGAFKSYYEDGSLSVNGQNLKDKGEGEWKYYYNNGKLKEKRNYVNDAEEGLHEEFFENGQKSASFMAKKGKINGEAIYFYKDGKVLARHVYENGVIRSAKYFDRSGATLSASEFKNDQIDILSYDINGYKKAHFADDQKGELTGPDTIFYPSGKISQVNHYQNGQLEGNVSSYYLNGKLKSEVNYTKGKESGYLIAYYTNGKKELEGWVIDGSNQGEWHYYDEKGRLTNKSYFLDNELDGYKEDYLANGRMTLERKYRGGWLERMTQFDDKNNILAVDSFPKGTGRYVRYYPGKKVMEQANYVKGDFDGAYQTFFIDGSPETSTFYKGGLRDSTYTSFYYGGQKNTEGSYKRDNKEGVWKVYNEDGTLFSTTTYRNDQKNGVMTRFSPNGNKNRMAFYKEDELDGTFIKYGPDGTLIYQIDFDNGKAIAYTYPGKDGQLVPPARINPLNGLLKAYFPNGKVARECTYSDGVPTGRDVHYFPDGRIWSVDTTEYNNSEGLYQEYYPDGTLKSAYPYKTDNVEGICREYNPNGTLKKEETYDNGSYNGSVKYFDAGGKPVKTMSYLFGTLIGVKHEK